ncbi:M16 family metallopeptidase [Duganella qianjiadongensis]|uniref:Insulinase family protein n=1 Tax=Duganella qianjiadongensis TaxID=2692176 RepID=A0ABW9VMU8_9BURK|nr:insulinase family protein [Duganella qianjiadongensis]MYM40797.1 insulinase family protein [Duganella qianjiadongensis]
MKSGLPAAFLRRAVLAALFSVTTLASAASAVSAALKLSDSIPVGPQVTLGKLSNGLSYYVQKNARPENRLELRLVIKAGSMQEDEDQQGLAHFLEHMAFNGSTHFKRHELVSYLQSVGVKFGADLNASTSFNETIYILPLPTDKPEVVEQGFQVLEDWAHGLSLNDADIDSERGIVLEELRMGKGVDDRVNKVLLPKLFNGSLYAQRLPIGQEAVLKNFKYEAIRRFYRDWYRPDLMAVVVVGDIEPARARALIERHFGRLKNPPHARPHQYAKIAARVQPEEVVYTDKEIANNSVFIRYPVLPAPEGTTVGDYRRKLLENMVTTLLNMRLYELTQQANPPYLQAGAGMNGIVHGYRSFSAAALLGKDGVQPAIQAMLQESQRARQFGFSEAELERVKKGMLRSYERLYNERDKSDSAIYAAELIRNFLEQETIPGIAAEYHYAQTLIPQITLADLNAVARSQLPDGGSKLMVYTGSADSTPPAAGELLALADAAEKRGVAAQEEKTLARQLMAQPPKAGSIVSESRDELLGLTRLTLSNGVKVVLKPTDFNNDQVIMTGLRFGGWSLFSDADLFSARYASSIVSQMGVQDFTPADIVKVLAGKTAAAGASIAGVNESVSAGSGSADIESMLQLVYLNLTAARKDATIFQSFVARQRELARNNLARPEAVLEDAVTATLYPQQPRVPRAPRPADFDQLQIDKVMGLYQSRLSSARDFTFFMTGSFDVEQIKPLLATYLASLPVDDVAVAFRDDGVRPVRGVVKQAVYAGSEPKSTISLTFTGDAQFSPRERMRLQALIEVMNIKLIEVLREKMGVMYSGGLRGNMERLPYPHYTVTASLPCAPENVDRVLAAVFAEIAKIAEQGAEEADLQKVKAAWLKNYRKSLRENGYWIAVLMNAYFNQSDPADVLTYPQRVEALTAAELKDSARSYLNPENYVQVVLYPQK